MADCFVMDVDGSLSSLGGSLVIAADSTWLYAGGLECLAGDPTSN